MKGRSESSTHDYGTLSSVHMHTHSSHPPGLRNPQRQLFSTQQLGALSLLSPSVSLVNTTALGRESFSKNKHRIVSSETFIAHDLAHPERVAIKNDSEGVLLSSPSHSCLSCCQGSWMSSLDGREDSCCVRERDDGLE